MRCHYTPIRRAKIQNTDITEYCWVRGATGTLSHCWWEWKMVLWKTNLVVSYKTKHTRTIGYCYCAPCYLPKGGKNLCPQKTCTQMFIAALFITAKTWKQPRCPSVGVWINKLVHPDNRILSNPKKKWATKPWINMEESNVYY